MQLRRVLGAYGNGWLNLLVSCANVLLYVLVLALPLLLLALFFPDQLEGKGTGSGVVGALAFAAVLIWVPLMASKMGMLVFKSDTDKRVVRWRKHPEVHLLREIVATEDAVRKAKGEDEDDA